MASIDARLRALRTVLTRRDQQLRKRMDTMRDEIRVAVRDEIQELRADAQAAVQAERDARVAGDANLQAQIDAIVNGGSP